MLIPNIAMKTALAGRLGWYWKILCSMVHRHKSHSPQPRICESSMDMLAVDAVEFYVVYVEVS